MRADVAAAELAPDEPAQLEIGEVLQDLAARRGVGGELGEAPVAAFDRVQERAQARLQRDGRRAGRAAAAATSAASRAASGPRRWSRTSRVSRTTAAPAASSPFVPAEKREVTGPGTAATGRPSCAAKSAVVSEPERSAASTTTVSAASPAMIRLRATKFQRKAANPGGSSDTTHPRAAIRS